MGGYPSWIQHVMLRFHNDPVKFHDDQTKITWTLGLMRGGPAARVWSDNEIEKGLDNNSWGTWKNFKKRLDENFSDPNREMVARNHLLSFKQQGMKATDFFTALELWFRMGKVTDAKEKHDYALNALDRTLYDQFILIGTPSTYDALKVKMLQMERDKARFTRPNAHQLDTRLSGASDLFKHTSALQGNHRRDSTGKTYTGAGQPMELDRFNTTTPRKTGGKPYNIMDLPAGQRPKPKNPCFYCVQANRPASHWRDECPLQKSNQGRGSSSQPQQQRLPPATQSRTPNPPQRQNERRFPPGPPQNKFRARIEEIDDSSDSPPSIQEQINALMSQLPPDDRVEIFSQVAKDQGF